MAATNGSKKEPRQKHKSHLDNPWFAAFCLIVISAAVVVVWLEVPACMGQAYKEPDSKGTYGDSFGSVNALFTGLAFAGVVFSILLQQRQIWLQREDFLSQLEEMQESRGTVEAQNRLLSSQNQLLRSQVDVALIQLQVSSMQLDAQIDEFELRQMGTHLPKESKSKLDQMRERVTSLNSKVGQLQSHIIQADRATDSRTRPTI